MADRIDVLKGLAGELRQIKDGVEAAVEAATISFEVDEFTDMAVFGFHFWRNVTNRVIHGIASGKLTLANTGNGNDRTFELDGYTMRIHRVSEDTRLPNGAEAAKNAARTVGVEGPQLFEEFEGLGRHLIIGVLAGPLYGLKEIFVAELVQEYGTDKYRYSCPPAVVYRSGEVFAGDGAGLPDEEVPDVTVTLKGAPEEPEVQQDDVHTKEDDQKKKDADA